MLFIVLLGIIGSGLAFYILWPYGPLMAFLGAPFGGGIAAGLAALWLEWHRRRRNPADNSRQRYLKAE